RHLPVGRCPPLGPNGSRLSGSTGPRRGDVPDRRFLDDGGPRSRRPRCPQTRPIIHEVNLRVFGGGGIYSGRLIAAALGLPILLLGALVALDYWVLEPALPSDLGHLALFAIGAAGVAAFSIVILARLGELHRAEVAQSRRLRALNEAGLALSAELETESLLHKIADLARVVGDARYAALGTFDEVGLVTRFYTSGISEEEHARIGHLPVGRGLLGLLPRAGRPIRLRDLHEHPASVGFPANHPPMTNF